ncbi:MAG: DUF4962 domain-containing protein, partial [Lentisphaeria bacterium]|nr:DUF4962 domain-containing protein [Lentisphaeria bacterium]
MKKILIRSALSFWLCLAFLAHGADHVSNAGFETGAPGASPPRWVRWGEAEGMVWVIDAAHKHTGRQSLRITDVNRNGNSYCCSERLPVAPNERYTVSCWVRAEKSQPARLAIQMLGAGSQSFLGWQGANVVAGPEWCQVVCVLDKLKRGTVAVRISLIPTAMDRDGTGTVWFDDVEFRKSRETDMTTVQPRTRLALDAPTGAYEVVYFPEDTQTVSVTPPTFVWKRQQNAPGYVLQYSVREDFAPADTTTVACPLSVHTPRQTLAPGRWFWRYGVGSTAEADMVFSRVRAFTIGSDAVKMPFPDVKETVARLAARRHPRIGVLPDGLQALRHRATGEWSAQIKTAIKQARDYAGKPLLPEPGLLPPQNDPTWGPVFIKIMQDVRQFLRQMDHCAFVYMLTGDEDAGQEARRRLMHTMQWDPNGATKLSHNDEPGTEIVRLCPRTYDRIHPLLSEAERETCRKVFIVRMPQLYEAVQRGAFESKPFSSHAMGYYLPDLTEACLAMAGEIDVEEWLAYCLQMLWAPFYPPYGGDDGGWAEGPGYWGWIAEVAMRIFVVVDRAIGVPVAQRPWLRQTGYYKLYGNPPYSKISPFGDGQDGAASKPHIMYILGTYFRDPYLLWYAEQKNYQPGLRALFLYGSPDFVGKDPSDLPQGRCFWDVGLACMHSDLANGEESVNVLMRSCPFGSVSHAYADQNAFVISAYGEALAIASGYYPYYGSPHHKQWSWETKAANCITIDGRGQNTRDWWAKGKITRFETTSGWDLAVGDATAAYDGRLERFHRHILFLKPTVDRPQPAIVIYDVEVAAGTATFEWWLHALDSMKIDTDQQRVCILRGNAGLQVDFLTPQALHFEQTDQFTVP